MNKKQKFSMYTGIAVLVVAVAGLAWRGMSKVPPNAARAWALVATVLLPMVTWAGWWFGHTEARGRLAGIDQAVDKVMGAATRAAGLRVGTARAMRRVLIDHARRHRSMKRGGQLQQVSMSKALDLFRSAAIDWDDWIAIHEALARLEKLDALQGQVVELRVFAGLTIDETAAALAVPRVRVTDDWRAAKAWLHRELRDRLKSAPDSRAVEPEVP